MSIWECCSAHLRDRYKWTEGFVCAGEAQVDLCLHVELPPVSIMFSSTFWSTSAPRFRWCSTIQSERRGNPRPSLTHYTGILSLHSQDFPWLDSRAVEHETWCAAATQTRLWILKQTVHLHPAAQITLEINLVQLLPDKPRGLAVSRRTRWNVPPVYPAFSYCKPLRRMVFFSGQQS